MQNQACERQIQQNGEVGGFQRHLALISTRQRRRCGKRVRTPVDEGRYRDGEVLDHRAVMHVAEIDYSADLEGWCGANEDVRFVKVVVDNLRAEAGEPWQRLGEPFQQRTNVIPKRLRNVVLEPGTQDQAVRQVPRHRPVGSGVMKTLQRPGQSPVKLAEREELLRREDPSLLAQTLDDSLSRNEGQDSERMLEAMVVDNRGARSA